MTAAPPTQTPVNPTADAGDKPEESEELTLQFQFVDVKSKLKKAEMREHYEQWGPNKTGGQKMLLHFQSNALDVVPEEYMDVVDELHALAMSGPSEKSNSNTIKIDHEFDRTRFDIRPQENGDKVTAEASIDTPRLKVSRDGVDLKWKIEVVIPDGKLKDLSKLIDSTVLLTAEKLQQDLFNE